MIVYHVTHKKNLAAIRKHGVLASLAQGRAKVSWWCDPELIHYTREHVALRHDWCAARLIVIAANIPRPDLIRTSKAGIYRCKLPCIHVELLTIEGGPTSWLH